MNRNTHRFIVCFFLFILRVRSNDLVNLNENFLATYTRARDHVLSQTSPLIICIRDNIIIHHRGKRYKERVIPKLYHDLKAISHIPFKIYLTVMFDTDGLSEDNFIELQRYLDNIQTIRNTLEFPQDILQNQYDIIDLSIRYLRTILSTKLVDRNQLKQFCKEARRLFALNIELAAQAHLDLLHEKVRVWYFERFNETERDTLRITITGPKTARHGFLEKTYFYHLIGEKHEGKHIIYAENVKTEEEALEVLGIWMLDAEAAAIFFEGDTERLHRDLLSDATAKYIEGLFKKSKTEL
ncbi:unnamed protein product [Adineta ricciae]|uniref:Uncharacterized protein n=1 Tax=Adineta ricciae TaxID=249248 RepID=A0A814U3T5_ADIRI|nr:unnamed protein product [Adineta ricciae]CAF1206694.1 unnamed protein product [Adineta ricciae]